MVGQDSEQTVCHPEDSLRPQQNEYNLLIFIHHNMDAYHGLQPDTSHPQLVDGEGREVVANLHGITGFQYVDYACRSLPATISVIYVRIHIDEQQRALMRSLLLR